MAGDGSRRFYLGGSRKGEVRASRRVRARRRESERCQWEERTAASQVAGADSQEVLDWTGTEGSSRWCLGRGYRDSPSGVTRYAVGEDGDKHDGKLVVLEAEEVRSGRRWFRVPFPDRWMAEYTKKGREEKLLGCLHEYGKEFVWYKGRWCEAREWIQR